MIIMIFHGRIQDWCLNLIFVVNSSNQAVVSYRHLECSATSPLWSYFGYFGTRKNFKISNFGQENSMLNQLTYSAPLRLLLTSECLSNNELGKIWCDFLVTFRNNFAECNDCNLTWLLSSSFFLFNIIFFVIEKQDTSCAEDVLTELHVPWLTI